jgi:hypothetical protein
MFFLILGFYKNQGAKQKLFLECFVGKESEHCQRPTAIPAVRLHHHCMLLNYPMNFCDAELQPQSLQDAARSSKVLMVPKPRSESCFAFL